MKKTFTYFIAMVFAAPVSLLYGQDLYEEGEEPQQVTEGHQFTEGPYWHDDGFLLYSDIPGNTIYKWMPGGEKEVFLEPSGHSNGITGDGEGGMIIVQHDGMVSRLTVDGETTVLADSYDGKRLNSPNDVAVTSDGTIFFTDPPYGVDENERELDFCGVYRLTKNGEPELLFDEFDTPNGVIFSPDESRFFVNDTETGRIMMFEIGSNGEVTDGVLFAEVGNASESGAADGMEVDEEGNLYSTGPQGIHVFDSEGNEIDQISTPERVTNLEWGGEDNRTLFMTSPSGVYALEMNVAGL